jgi:lipopolysaccharide transport system ATP-binding protein
MVFQMSFDLSIQIRNVGKSFAMFSKPQDRLKQMCWGRKRQYYQEFLALKEINIDVYKGETIGIIGENGSGKSTLLSIICGNLAPTCGEITVRGRISALLQLGAGFNPEFTGRENVYVNGIVLGSTKGHIDERFDEIAKFADIGDFMNHPVKTYSSGMFVRLAFAVAINVDPDILIIDEALAVGDMAFQRKCYARMESIKRSGATIVFVSHALETVLDICDRAVLLHGGESLFTGKAKETVARYQKLSAAPENLREAIVDEIRKDDAKTVHSKKSNYVQDESVPNVDKDIISENLFYKQAKSSTIEFQEESYYDNNLISSSIVVYPENGAKINNPRIVTSDSKMVNCLISGEHYWLCYEVSFSENNSDVRFYNMIKTVTGVQLGGGTYPSIRAQGFSVNLGEVVNVTFEFKCMLGRGMYFINCGVGTKSGISLNRIIDAVAFRVDEHHSSFSFGTIDFCYKSHITCEDYKV